MNASARRLVAGAVAIGSLGGWWLASNPAATVARRTTDEAIPSRAGAATPDTTTRSAGATVVGESRVDAMQAYVALRDDVNPKARLRLIEDWSRERAPGTSLDLLSQAMVDPNEEVRARAQDLFERGLSADARRESEQPAILFH